MFVSKGRKIKNLSVLYLYPKLNLGSKNELFSGGAQKRAYQIALYFTRLGLKVYFASEDNMCNIVEKLKDNGIMHFNVQFVNKSPFTLIRSFLKLSYIIRKYKIDVIHSHHRRTTLIAFFVSKAFRKPMIYNARCTYKNKKIFRIFAGNNIIAVSQGVKENLVNYFGIDSNKIKVIYNGTDITPSTCDIKNRIKKELSLKENDRIVSVIGRLSEQKGHKYLIEALPVVIKKFPSLKVMFVGNGELIDSLKRQIGRIGIENNIIFCGHRNEVAPFIEISEFTILPSLWEGLPGSIIESLSLGKPVVATIVGGTPEVIANKVNGILVGPKDVKALSDAIIYMLSHQNETKEMGEKGREIAVEKFSLNKMLEQYREYYINLGMNI